MTYNPEPKYDHGDQLKIGILLANLGTPDAPTAKALRPYLRQFLSDTRVVEIPRIIWWFILNCIILVIRPKKSAEKSPEQKEQKEANVKKSKKIESIDEQEM